MFDIQPVYIDIFVLVLTLISIVLGFMRGFVNELFTIIGWLAAALATVILLPYLRGFGQSFFDSTLIADLVTSSVIFLGTLGLVTLTSYMISDYLKKTRLSALDRTLGVAFGALRSLIVFALGFIIIAWIWAPDDRPDCITEAKTRPIIETVAAGIIDFIPGTDDIKLTADNEDKSALDAVMRPEDQEAIKDSAKEIEKETSAYTEEQRKKLNKVFQQSGQ